MREWIFSESFGKYSIDLGGSNVDCLTLKDILDNEDINSLVLGYGSEAGMQSLRQVIAEKYCRISDESVMVCHGGQEAFTLLVRSLKNTNNGEIIVLGSGWLQHSSFPIECGLKVHHLDLDGLSDDSIITLVTESINCRTRAVVAASPDNPSGWKASNTLITSISLLAEAYDALLIIDEEYVIDYKNSAAGLASNIAITSSLSKFYGLPALRLGWCIARPSLIELCIERKHSTTITNSLLCENIAILALKKSDEIISKSLTLCRNGREIVSNWVDENIQIHFEMSEEVLPYCWLRLDPHLDDLVIARKALSRGILVMPGVVFGKPGFLRIAVGRQPKTLKKGLIILGEITDLHL